MIPLDRIGALIPSLGRENGHEVVAAARAIGAALRGAGHDWHDLAQACSSIEAKEVVATTSSSPSRARTRPASFGDLARACRDLDRGRLAPRERTFVADMCGKGFTFDPTPRQAAWLGDILNRLQGRAAA